ncbi:carboxymuconolactone decarboxylase family protein [Croceibacterium sp. LX-88]|uniref:Carboxymuconolactone decarboxylase family protein n=1 Tax=Croceibacterium selenioxidans TaxID=2838833 RepID=A0ABS5W4E8_9SPHN|nr:carboxymuconolactone decarboxylase family protein [Croceibacterium selenioxidans]MBT2134627.1 carboxymuconolactone decarboxylase family protein [Croceibacterium selenioxidans]
MTPRMNIFQVAPEGTKAMLALEASIEQSGLEHGLLELVRLRASQLNGCAFCIHMHVKDAVKNGESDMRIHMLDAWRGSPLFTDRERAALNWTESLTRISKTHAPDEDFAMLQSQFSEKEIAFLTLLIGSINVWNRVQVGLRAVHPIEEPTAAAA